MIAQPPVRGSVRCEQTDLVPRLEASIRHTLCEIEGGGERRLSSSVGDEFDAPEEASATDVADVGVSIEACVEQGA